MLSNRFKTCSSSIKVKLFRSFLCNAYGCHLWSTYKEYLYKRVLVAINNIYRQLFRILRGGRVCDVIFVNHSPWPFCNLLSRVLYCLCYTYKLCIVPHIIVQIGLPVDGVCIHSPKTRFVGAIGCETWTEFSGSQLPTTNSMETSWGTEVRYFVVYDTISWIWHKECQPNQQFHG
jgi:hypothetical protein